MKIILVACLLMFFGTCSRSNKEPEGPAAALQTKSYSAVGTVKDIDATVPMIEIDHEDIQGLMPAMQMQFRLKDKSLLDGIKVGDRIEFTVENGVGGMRVTAVRKK